MTVLTKKRKKCGTPAADLLESPKENHGHRSSKMVKTGLIVLLMALFALVENPGGLPLAAAQPDYFAPDWTSECDDGYCEDANCSE